MGNSGSGEFERLVMLAIVQLGDDAYGAAILDELERRTGRDTASGAVYVTLGRLEAKGLISSRLGEPTRERGGRAKRLVRLEAAGLEQLRAAHDEWLRMTDGLGPLLEGRGG
jgi:DNA-binding PadR family transcriptional regulator